jgi:DNA-binding transcriptional MerR regulator
MSKYYKINEVAKLTSVSVRTLHYYDEINLLNPSYKTTSGHRLYSKDDLLKLQQIITFKFMGFSLTNVQHLLQNPDFSMHASLKIQANELSKEALRIDKISKFLQYLVDHVEAGEAIDWEIINKVTETLQLSEIDRQKWYEKYLTTAELSEFEKRCIHYSDDFWQDYHKRWEIMFEEVKQNLMTDPGSDTGIKLAKKWLTLVEELHGNSESRLRYKLWEGYKAGIIPPEQLVYDKDIIAYITKAIEKLYQNSNK